MFTPCKGGKTDLVLRTLDPLSSDALYLYLFQYKAESTNFISLKVCKYRLVYIFPFALVSTKAAAAIERSIYPIPKKIRGSLIKSGDS